MTLNVLYCLLNLCPLLHFDQAIYAWTLHTPYVCMAECMFTPGAEEEEEEEEKPHALSVCFYLNESMYWMKKKKNKKQFYQKNRKTSQTFYDACESVSAWNA